MNSRKMRIAGKIDNLAEKLYEIKSALQKKNYRQSS